jgi:Concanavalin A-like lectin/glucanases superfamily
VTGKARWIVGLVAALMLSTAAPALAANVLPVGQWDLNEGAGTVAHNDSPLTANGTLSGAVSWTTGRFRGGLSFTGTNGVVDIPDSKLFEGTNVTVSAWVEANGTPGDFKYIVSKGANGCCTGSYGLETGANGGLVFYAANSATTAIQSPDAGYGIWNGKWHNVIGTFDGSTVRLYVDGKQVGSGTSDTTPIHYNLPGGNDLQIGNYTDCPQLGWIGSIDEVKVFDRALGPGEIALAYAASNLLPGSSPFDVIL